MANGMRLILFVLVPAAAAILVLSDPIIQLIYQRGEFDAAQTAIVSTALFLVCFSLPTNGLYSAADQHLPFQPSAPLEGDGAGRDPPGRLHPGGLGPH